MSWKISWGLKVRQQEVEAQTFVIRWDLEDQLKVRLRHQVGWMVFAICRNVEGRGSQVAADKVWKLSPSFFFFLHYWRKFKNSLRTPTAPHRKKIKQWRRNLSQGSNLNRIPNRKLVDLIFRWNKMKFRKLAFDKKNRMSPKKNKCNELRSSCNGQHS